MNTFTLFLYSTTQFEKIADIISFKGKDASGSFGILANHARMMTSLEFGLMQFTYGNNLEEYLALPGGILYFVDNKLMIVTRHYFRSTDYKTIESELDKKLKAEEVSILDLKTTLQRLDENVLKKLLELKEGSI